MMVLYTLAYAQQLADTLQADEEDGWTYLVILVGDRAYVQAVDAEGHLAGTF